ncbi:unnamed protein product [Closterium sp. NIES-53]
MKRDVAAGADVYAVDIAIVEEVDKPTGTRSPNRIRARGTTNRTASVQTDTARARRAKEAVRLLVREKIHPTELIAIRRTDPVHTEEGRRFPHVYYRALNRVTVKSRYPIPRADELIEQLRTARVFSKIDLRGGHHQIRVEPSDCAKTAFRTRYGSFEYTVMPFGLTNMPATFQMTTNKAFRPLLDKCVIIYLDDILVYSRDKQQHLADLEEVFTVLDKHRLLTKGSKCEFFQDRLEFLGHVISEAGVEIDKKKIGHGKIVAPPDEHHGTAEFFRVH